MGALCPPVVDNNTDITISRIIDRYDLEIFYPGVEELNNPISHSYTNILTLNGSSIANKIQPVIELIQKKQGLYEDISYPTQQFQLRVNAQQAPKIFEWKRLQDVFSDTKVVDKVNKLNIIIACNYLFHSAPQFSYFQIFLTFLSRFPALIQDCILTQQNKYGLHVVKIFKKGIQSSMIIDNKILCKFGNLSPAFIQLSNTTQIWPFIFQKAWMKKNRDIPSIFYLEPQQVIQWFLNIPTRRINLRRVNEQDFRNFLENNSQSYFYFFRSNLNPQRQIGLPPHQYFSLVQIKRIQNQNVFYFKNPSGNFTFRGQFAQKANQNAFPLTLNEIFQQFSICTTVYYYRSFKHTNKPIECEPNSQVFIKFTLERSTLTAIRIIGETGTKIPVMIDLIKIENNEQISGGSQSGIFGDQIINVFDETVIQLQKGEYLLRLVFKSKQKTKINSTVCFYSQNKIHNIDANSRYSSLFNEYLLAQCQYNFRQQSANHHNVSYCVVPQNNRFMFYFVNQTYSRDKKLTIQMTLPNAFNIECRSHKMNERYQIQNIQVLEETIVVLQKVILSEESKPGENIRIQCQEQ